MFDSIDRAMQSIVDEGVPGVDILIYKGGKEVFRSFKGYSDKERNIPMNGKEKYNMYSCSKPITATATMQLIESGLITLDTPLYAVMPQFKDMYVRHGGVTEKAHNHITIRHLLTMTAGFSYDLESKALQASQKDTSGECPTVETVMYLSQEPLAFEPGTRWLYSLCHDVLAGVVEVVSDMRFGEYVDKRIFKPLGMSNSTFLLPHDQLESVCAQYKATPNGIEKCPKEIQYYKLGNRYESGGAGLVSTVEDYVKFLEGLRTASIISKESVELMLTDISDAVDMRLYWPASEGYGYGLGVRCAKRVNSAQISDFGWGGAAGSYLAIDRENGVSLFYGMHVLHIGDLDGRKNILKYLKDDLTDAQAAQI